MAIPKMWRPWRPYNMASMRSLQYGVNGDPYSVASMAIPTIWRQWRSLQYGVNGDPYNVACGITCRPPGGTRLLAESLVHLRRAFGPPPVHSGFLSSRHFMTGHLNRRSFMTGHFINFPVSPFSIFDFSENFQGIFRGFSGDFQKFQKLFTNLQNFGKFFKIFKNFLKTFQNFQISRVEKNSGLKMQ